MKLQIPLSTRSCLGGEVGNPHPMRPKGSSKQGALKRERERASPAGSGPSLLAKRKASAEKRKLPQKQQPRLRGGSPSPSSSSEDNDDEDSEDEAEEEASGSSGSDDDGDDGFSAGGVCGGDGKGKSHPGAAIRATANGASRARGSSRRGGSSSAVAAVATALAESDVVPLRPRAARQLPDDDVATTVAGKAAVKGAAKDAGRSKDSGKAETQQRGVKQPVSGLTLAPKPLLSTAPLGQKENVSSAKAIEILGLHKVISIRLRHPNIPVLQQKT